MVTSTEHKVRPLSAVDSELDRSSRDNPPMLARKNKANDTTAGNMVGWVVLAIVVIFGGYLFYSYQSPLTPVPATTTKIEAAPPATAPAPAVPPASSSVTPKADAPTAPPADAPVTPPAAGTATPPATTTTP